MSSLNRSGPVSSVERMIVRAAARWKPAALAIEDSTMEPICTPTPAARSNKTQRFQRASSDEHNAHHSAQLQAHVQAASDPEQAQIATPRPCASRTKADGLQSALSSPNPLEPIAAPQSRQVMVQSEGDEQPAIMITRSTQDVQIKDSAVAEDGASEQSAKENDPQTQAGDAQNVQYGDDSPAGHGAQISPNARTFRRLALKRP